MACRHQVFAVSLLVLLATTKSANVPRPLPTANLSNEAISVPFADIQQRLLMQKATHPSQPSSSAVEPAEKCSSSTGGVKHRDTKECGSLQYTLFVQTWVPGFCYAHSLHKSSSKAEAARFNQYLYIHGLWPKYTIPKMDTNWTDEAERKIDKNAWLNGTHHYNLYKHEWDRHGKKSGLTPLEFVDEIQQLHALHSTPPNFINSTKVNTTLTSAKPQNKKVPVRPLHINHRLVVRPRTIHFSVLKELFHKNAFLICLSRYQREYLYEVRYCHQVDPKTHKAFENVVEYSKCEPGKAESECGKKKGEIIIFQEWVALQENYPDFVPPTGTYTKRRDTPSAIKRKEDRRQSRERRRQDLDQ